MLDGRVLEASQVEYKPLGKPPLQREPGRRGPEAVQLQHHGGHERFHRLATVAANYGLKTVVDQHSQDIAARITPLEVDTKVANALLGAVGAAGRRLQAR